MKKTIKYNIEDLEKYARKKDGHCLSSSYVNCKIKYIWKCSKGHVWPASWNSISRGRWCPDCTEKKRNIIKYSFEEVKDKLNKKNIQIIISSQKFK